MLERLASTGSGFPTAYAGDQALHSRYNPPAEAEKYVNSLNFREEARFFILLEPGLGYAVEPLRKKFPAAVILSLHVSDFCAAQETCPLPDGAWSPASGETLLRFLEDRLPDTEAAAVAIVEWRPAQAAYGGAYLKLFAETVEYIKRADANKRTLDNFGRRWFKNVFKNLRLLKQVPRFRPFAAPLVIAGAGPSLEETIPLLAEQKKRSPLFVLAASSAALALLHAGLPPDLILGTDGGNWALLHLYEAIRAGPGANAPPFAAALSAALPSQFAALPWLPISDGSLWQNLLLRGAGLPFESLPQRGTVTATALDLAFRLCQGPVFIAGTDLGHRDIQTHARPYSFERLLAEGASRLRPAYSQAFVRAAAIAASGSHGIYAQWFARQMAAYPDRLFSLGGNNAVFKERSANLPMGKNTEPNGGVEIVSLKDYPSTENLSATRARPLLRALDSDETRDALLRELAPLLFPGDSSMADAPSATMLAAVREEILAACGAEGGYEGGHPHG